MKKSKTKAIVMMIIGAGLVARYNLISKLPENTVDIATKGDGTEFGAALAGLLGIILFFLGLILLSRKS